MKKFFARMGEFTVITRRPSGMSKASTEDQQLLIDLSRSAGDAMKDLFSKRGDRYLYTVMIIDRYSGDCNFVGNGDRDVMLKLIQRAAKKGELEIEDAPLPGKPN